MQGYDIKNRPWCRTEGSPKLVALIMYRSPLPPSPHTRSHTSHTSRSPVFASFSASLKGLPTIRAFSSQRRFHAAFLEQLQANGEWFYAFMVTAR